MADSHAKEINCKTCSKVNKVMKRCTRCKSVMYCSRECQIKDWPGHQQACRPIPSNKAKPQPNTTYNKNDNSIFTDEATNTGGDISRTSYPPLVDFSKAFKEKNEPPPLNSKLKPEGKCYLFVNKYYTDVPEINSAQPTCNIVVKCNKEKHKLEVQQTWSGVELYKFLSYKLSIPLEKLKLIHKGKVLTRETIHDTLRDKALYQAVGELAENEDNVDQRDISVMMQQTGLDRNAAVQALKKKGDLLDALLEM